jgi:acyl carrier protein
MAQAERILRAVVHGVLAAHLGIEVAAIEDEQRIDRDLGLDAFDLVLVALRLEERAPERGEFPIDALDPSMTVREVVAVHLSWAVLSSAADEAPDTLRMATSFPPPSARDSPSDASATRPPDA